MFCFSILKMECINFVSKWCSETEFSYTISYFFKRIKNMPKHSISLWVGQLVQRKVKLFQFLFCDKQTHKTFVPNSFQTLHSNPAIQLKNQVFEQLYSNLTYDTSSYFHPLLYMTFFFLSYHYTM